MSGPIGLVFRQSRVWVIPYTVAMLFAVTAGPLAAQAPDTSCALGDSARLIAMSFGDLRLCLSSQDYDRADEQRPHEWVARSPHSSLETRRPNDVRKMEVLGLTVTWTINGRVQPVDSLADRWRIGMLNVLDSAWEADHLRATVAGLRAEIAAVPATRARIAAVEAMIRQLEDESQRQEDVTRVLQRQYDALDTESKVGAINLDLRTLNADERIARLNARIAGLDSAHVADLEQRIVALHVDERLAELDVGLRNAVARLRGMLD